jgi:hypothetical protein
MKNPDLKAYQARKAEKSLYEPLMQECFDYILPRKADITTARAPGQKLNGVTLYDSTGIQANELFAATLASGLTNPQTMWFFLTTGDEELDRDDEVRKWMAKAHHTLHNILNNSNFHSEAHEFYLDLGAIGTGTLSIEEDEDFVVRFAARHIKEITIAEDHRGWVNTVDRTYMCSPAQLIERFGEKKVGKKVRDMYEKGDQTKLEVVHIVAPRSPERGLKGPKARKFSSKYYLLCEGTSCTRVATMSSPTPLAA